jgi:YD repeat-containing protein
VTSIAHHKPTGELLAYFGYDYDKAGNRTALHLVNGDTVYFTYDAYARLTGEVRKTSGLQDV